ncbi:MAG: hypothetical protein SCH70_10055 [Candidatus Methanoperedens sp.]|nr:hypothetical protein [Candidatus Methanoperedens sp.]
MMHIEKIEHGPEKVGSWSQAAFVLIVVLTLLAVAITVTVVVKLVTSEPADASTREFTEGIGISLAVLIFILGSIIYLYVKGLLQDEYVTTIE